jgi:hypothetical protein
MLAWRFKLVTIEAEGFSSGGGPAPHTYMPWVVRSPTAIAIRRMRNRADPNGQNTAGP